MFFFDSNQNLGTIYAVSLKCEECTKTTNDIHLMKIEICDDAFVYKFDINQFITIKDTLERNKIYYFFENNARFF